MKLLEEELGVALFERQARGIRLTEHGSAMLLRAQSLLHDAEELKSAVVDAGQEPAGPLRLGAAAALRHMVVAPMISSFRRNHPKVRFTIREGTSRGMMQALGAGEIDIALVSSHEALDIFRVQPLASESLCWIGPSKTGLRMSKPCDIRALTVRPLILTSYPNSVRVIFDRALSRAGLTSDPLIEADMATVMIELVKEGAGYTVLPYGAIHEVVERGSVCACPIRQVRIEWVVAVSKERAQTIASSLAVEALLNICAAQIKVGKWKTASLEPISNP